MRTKYDDREIQLVLFAFGAGGNATRLTYLGCPRCWRYDRRKMDEPGLRLYFDNEYGLGSEVRVATQNHGPDLILNGKPTTL